MANNVDPDQTTRSAASDLDLHCLMMSVCPNIYFNMVLSLYHFVFNDDDKISLSIPSLNLFV